MARLIPLCHRRPRGRRLHQAAGLLLLASVLLAARAHAAHERLRAGDPVRFALNTTRGRLTSRALEGRTYAVVFWNTGSKKFAQAVPELRRLVKQHAGQGFVLIGYSVDASPAKARRAVADGGLSWVQAFDQDQDFPFYEAFYTQRSPVPGVFLVSDTGELRWFGPLTRLTEEVEAALPTPEDAAGPGADPGAAGLAATAAHRALLQDPPDAEALRRGLRDIPPDVWDTHRGVRLTLRRAARRLSRLDEGLRSALREAAAADPADAARFERLWALRPEPRAAAETPDTPPQAPGPDATPADPDADPDADADAARALAQGRTAEAAGDLLTAWERYRAAANDPGAGEHGPAARAELRRMEDTEDFAPRLAAARRERAAGDLYAKALNLIAAGQRDAADATLREIRRDYHDTQTADAAERALTELGTDDAP